VLSPAPLASASQEETGARLLVAEKGLSGEDESASRVADRA
jgi:hypothetical protein